MRWIYFALLALAAAVLQTTLGQALWVQTAWGWVGPVFPAAAAVFAALYARSATDAALAGWALGFAMDLTLSGGGMGLHALLYAAATAGVYAIREGFFRDRIATQMLLALLLCLLVHEPWVLLDSLVFGTGAAGLGRRALQAMGISAYTALLAPLVIAPLRRMERLLVAAPAAGRAG